MGRQMRILFPDNERARSFVWSCSQHLHELDVVLAGNVVTIENADHPELRADLLHAASHLGGTDIPDKGGFRQ
jgi:hypothetical protein